MIPLSSNNFRSHPFPFNFFLAKTQKNTPRRFFPWLLPCLSKNAGVSSLPAPGSSRPSRQAIAPNRTTRAPPPSASLAAPRIQSSPPQAPGIAAPWLQFICAHPVSLEDLKAPRLQFLCTEDSLLQASRPLLDDLRSVPLSWLVPQELFSFFCRSNAEKSSPLLCYFV
jgi:hypothetical protein